MKFGTEQINHGADPEVFSVLQKDSTVISPALLEEFAGIKMIDGDVKHPIYIRKKEFTWMGDGVAWEITLRQPHESFVKMHETVKTALDVLREYIEKIKFEGESLQLLVSPTVGINPELYLPYLEKEKIKMGFIFGCDRDYDAIDPKYECGLIDVKTHKFRYGGGHIHTSGMKYFEYFPEIAIRFYAMTVGNFVTANSPVPDLERQRVQTYGRPGRFRPQKYKGGISGIEYRTPSNSWINFTTPQIEELEFWIKKGLTLFYRERVDLLEEYLEKTVDAIVDVDQNLAKEILKELKNK